MIIEDLVFRIGVVVGLANLVGVWASRIGFTSYYPLSGKGWNYYVFWGLSHMLNVSLLVLGILQFRTVGLLLGAFYAGLGLFVSGFFIVVVATFDLGVEQTQGLSGELKTTGLYRYSRNPQYVGYILATIGYALIVAAPLVVPLCVIYLAWWISFPYAEEPWLRKHYGTEYEQYVKTVPRFVGFRTFRAIKERIRTRSRE
jgi:protein-S-isoprenylcysteine O-methyltransferase Ste14